MEAYSMDLSELVVDAYDADRGRSRQLAEEFEVSGAWGFASCSGCDVKREQWWRRSTVTDRDRG
jgi:hypothetical protein